MGKKKVQKLKTSIAIYCKLKTKFMLIYTAPMHGNLQTFSITSFPYRVIFVLI